MAQEFRDTFGLTQDDCRALTCVECLRNLLAHAVLSNQFKFNDGPALAYVPKSMKGPCFKCRPHLLQDHENKGIRLDLDSRSINTYFKDFALGRQSRHPDGLRPGPQARGPAVAAAGEARAAPPESDR